MPLSIPQIVKGAVVEDCLTLEGTPKKVRRRGVIVDVKYPGNMTHSRNRVKEIHVLFEKDGKPEVVANHCLNLVKSHDQVTSGRIRQNEENEYAETKVDADRLVTVRSDKTGLTGKESLSEHNMGKGKGKYWE